MPTQVENHAAGTASEQSPRANLINVACAGWVRRLIDLSRRNNLLFYKPVLGGTIEVPNRSAALTILLSGESVLAQDLLADPVDRPARVLQIARKAMENLEEKGLQTLYLVLGFATWTADDGGRDINAPIFLLPIAFKVKGRDLSTVEVCVVGEPQINPVLLHVLENEFNITVSGEELLQTVNGEDSETEAVASPQAASVPSEDALRSRYAQAFALLLSRAAKVPGFATEGSAVISNFSFQKLAMVNDIKQAGSLLMSNEIVAAIAGDITARTRVGSSQISVDPQTLDANPPDKEFCVVEADSSQQCAISGIAAGQSAVVHGPPGTGKSQTITNLIATLVGNGKTVLFVAEKRAALEVVQKRLTASGLDHLAIDLHGAELTSKKVMERIARTLGTIRESRPPQVEDVHRQFIERRAKLNRHVQRMHTISERTGKTVYDMQGAILRLPLSGTTTVRWRGVELACISPSKAEEVRDLLREAGGFESLFTRTDSSPWTGLAFENGEAVQQAIDTARQLAYQEMPSLVVKLRELGTVLGFRMPRALKEIGELSALLKTAREHLERYDSAVFSADLPALLADLNDAKDGGVRALWLTITNSSFRSIVKQVIQLRKNTKAPARQLYAELVEVLKTKDQWTGWSVGVALPVAYAGDDSLAQTISETRRDALLLQSIVGQSNWDLLDLDDLARRVEALAADASTPYQLLRLTQIEAKLKSDGVQRLLEDLRLRKPHASLWGSTFDYAWLNSALDEAAIPDPEVRGFMGSTHNSYVDDFKDLDSSRLKAATTRVRRLHAERTIAAMNAHPEQEQLIKQEAAKTRRHKPLRYIFKEACEVLTAVCPCWMASPLSVSQLIHQGASFDYVIFDEASQILPEDAIPAIMRGKHVVVAGDSNQLPPTAFFSAGSDEDGDAEAADGYESLLDMMRPFAKGFHLNWHYRSRDEALIAFSNHHIYDDRLVTFPGPGGPPAVTHVLVDYIPEADGQEDSSGAEVRRVIELVLEHARQTPARTLGVITMGIKHAMRIQSALDRALATQRGLTEFFDAERPERFFIKNLERVQGDERDSIILSVGYGKDRAGNLPLRFGPILSVGGRRRLNVAATRAKETMTVVSSFSYADIDVTKVKPMTGLDFLRNFLQYASSNGRIFTHGDLTNEPMNDFEADVYDGLTAKGIKLVPQVGCSKFRLDFAACHPTEPGRFVLAIECDGATYHSSYTARDRDRLRQQQLENLGWVFHRIWSTDWFNRKNEEVDRAVAAYERALNRNTQLRDLSVLPTIGSPQEDPPDLLIGLTSQRSSLFPPIPKRASISDYTRSEMKALYEWVASDGRLRTHDEFADEMFQALPFTRRGVRIEAVLRETIRRCEQSGEGITRLLAQ